MVYNRASASDYDAWDTTYGNRGWGSDKLIPLLKKVNFMVLLVFVYRNSFSRRRRIKEKSRMTHMELKGLLKCPFRTNTTTLESISWRLRGLTTKKGL